MLDHNPQENYPMYAKHDAVIVLIEGTRNELPLSTWLPLSILDTDVCISGDAFYDLSASGQVTGRHLIKIIVHSDIIQSRSVWFILIKIDQNNVNDMTTGLICPGCAHIHNSNIFTNAGLISGKQYGYNQKNSR